MTRAGLFAPPVVPETPVSAEALRASVPGARVTVVGGARSGQAAARLLARRGATVFLTDAGPDAGGVAETLKRGGVESEFGGHSARALDADWLVVSPGVPTTSKLVQSALRQKRPVFSEIEVASWFCDGPIIAVTGSNGKTTTTTLIAHVLRTAGRKHVVAGNIGLAFADYVDDVDAETAVVLEVSSFQLDHVATFRPHVAVLLNVTPDHLDRYGGDLASYAAAKFRLFDNLTAADWLVYNADDALVRERALSVAAARGLTPYAVAIDDAAPPEPATPPTGEGGAATPPNAALAGGVERGAFARGGEVVLALPPPGSGPDSPPTVIHDDPLMPTSDLALRGRHNLYNSLASAVVARAMEIRSDVVRESLTSFEGVPHRLETVRTVDGVRFVNDSKATNVNAVWYALESVPAHDDGSPSVVLVAGGRDKGNDYEPLERLVAEKVKGIVAIGEGAEAVERELGPHTALVARAASMEEAIGAARRLAAPGDTVLLSPACASFDMFEDYEDRGDTFKRLVRAL
ncbi:Mur ligase family protein [Rubrivirga sp. S365]|uniref:UDP-N-acetylmuramoylalanine--D-glutamate ligase n=1 Tax=Rubrivirga litoralis TaxID=3075598 RepID=A0ABU3BLP7_9BACT|nr:MULTISPECIES: Mur ligase family protein [unclassified Rubrivirga]MDT0630210.1 Mur ligase family protein [Rubrivirga sp. F394]MDT7855721.1 Mur ligase family protein [Rubrivirga sp. S365]